MNILQPLAWYFAGPAIGLVLFLLLLYRGKSLGVSNSFQHICAVINPFKIPFLNYSWKQYRWSFYFVFGILLGGYIATLITGPGIIEITTKTKKVLAGHGLTQFHQFLPGFFDLSNIYSVLIFGVLGGFFIGFGTRFAGGCTSGHAIMGMASLNKSSLFAVIGFFIGGLLITWLAYPFLIQLVGS